MPDTTNYLPWAEVSESVETGEGIGWGLVNTWRISMNAGPMSAAWVAASYRGGGFRDWFLPYLGELQVLFRLAWTAETARAEMNWSQAMWSSTEDDEDHRLAIAIESNEQQSVYKDDVQALRPIRAFWGDFDG